MFYCGYNKCDLANGPGARVSLFVSGCSLHCKGCFSPSSWNKEYGQQYTEQFQQQLLLDLDNKWIDGLSILGGDPLEDYNYDTVLNLCKLVKQKCPEKSIWLWTGRPQKKVSEMSICQYVDVIVSEPYIESKKCDGRYFGSGNQKVWYAKDMSEYNDESRTSHHSSKQFVQSV